MSSEASGKPLVLIAIGGNSLIKDSKRTTVRDQLRATSETSHHIAAILKEGWRVIITHGNGPQVGFMLIRSEAARHIIHQVPLDSLVADSQGATGYQLCMTLSNELKRWDLPNSAICVVTQVLVDADDPAFQNPSKPIGQFYTEAQAQDHQKNDGWIMREDAGRGWRRVVPSPAPLQIIEEPVIKKLVEQDVVVIACGGGGIPVVHNEYGDLIGCSAVIDKDFASAMLAADLAADKFVISTAVDRVAINFGKPDQQYLDHITLAEARQYMEEGHFAPGSMKPKIEAALNYLDRGGKEVIITSPPCLRKALKGEGGTHITP